MAESGLGLLRETHDVQIEWRAFELHPLEAPPIPPEVEAAHRERIAAGWPRVQQIARERFGVEMQRMEGVRHPTRLAHVGAKFAIQGGQGAAFHLAIFRAHWQERRDISSPDTLAEIAVALGLDEAKFRAALADERLLAAVFEDERWAAENGLTGVPAFIFGQRYLVVGAQTVEVLRQVADRCLAEGRVA